MFGSIIILQQDEAQQDFSIGIAKWDGQGNKTTSIAASGSLICASSNDSRRLVSMLKILEQNRHIA